MSEMGSLEFGRLAEAWRGEAADFTPLLSGRLDQLGSAIGIDLTSVGRSEVPTTGGRRIDIVAEDSDGSEFVVENQYGRADHDHLTRGLAYAVARRAQGLIVVAEEHRDEFRAVAEYLNALAELDAARGIPVWLVEVKAVRIDGSRWAPLFLPVVEPNEFTTAVGGQTTDRAVLSAEEFWGRFGSGDERAVIADLVDRWTERGNGVRYMSTHVVLQARGPSTSGIRSVLSIYIDGAVSVPFSSYAGTNSGIGINALMTDEFRARADALFGFSGTEKIGKTAVGWLSSANAIEMLEFCIDVAQAYEDALHDEGAQRPFGN